MKLLEHAIELLSCRTRQVRSAAAPALRVLIVDDVDADRRAICARLVDGKTTGQVVETASLAEATEIVARGSIDAVVLHQRTPHASYAALRERAAEVAILVIAELDKSVDRQQALPSGGADYVLFADAPGHLDLLPQSVRHAVELRRSKATLEAMVDHFRRILDSIPFSVFTCDASGLISYSNQETEALWGRPPRLFDPTDRFCGTARFSELDGSPVVREECWQALTRNDGVTKSEMLVDFGPGKRRQILAYANPLRDVDGTLVGAINVWVDVTEMRRLEYRQRLSEAHQAHSDRLRSLGSLSHGIAHDFNNQLATIMGVIQLAELDLPVTSNARALLREAIGATRRARDLVQRLQGFCLVAQGELTPLVLDVVIRDAVELIRPTLPRHLSVAVNLTGNCPPVACCSADIHNVIAQLVTLAAHVMPIRPGVIELQLEWSERNAPLRTRFPILTPRQTVRLSLRADGAERLADLAFPDANGTLPERLGVDRETSLSVAAVCGIVNRHEGAIVVDNPPGAATTIHIFLPPHVPRPPAPAADPDRYPPLRTGLVSA